jgi:hypothetical protein
VAKLLLGQEHGRANKNNSHTTKDRDSASFAQPLASLSSGRRHAKKIAFSLLLQQHTNLNIVNMDGLTPLVCAISFRHSKIARLILEHEIELSCLLWDKVGGELERTHVERGSICALNVAANKDDHREVNGGACKIDKEMLLELQQSQARLKELLNKSKTATVIEAQQKECTTNSSASISTPDGTSSSSSTTTTMANESLLETLASQQKQRQQHPLSITALADINMKQQDKLEGLNALLNEQVVHLEEEPKQQQQQKQASVDACIIHNVEIHVAMSSIQQLVQSLVSQQRRDRSLSKRILLLSWQLFWTRIIYKQPCRCYRNESLHPH